MALLDVQNLSFRYDDSDTYIFKDVSFSLDTNWKTGFIGRNGRGKTTFLKLLLGKYEYQGTISSTYTFSYFPFPVGDKSLDTIEIVTNMYPEYEYWKLQKEFQLLDIDEEILYRPFKTLSNGEQTKVLLAVLFSKESQYLLIDEPTDHLDEEARGLVSQYLKKKTGFILVCHDREFMDACVDHVLVINKTNIEIQRGNFSSWYQNKENQDHFEATANARLKRDIKRLKEASLRTTEWSNQIEKTKIGAADKGRIGHKSAKMMKRAKNIEKRQLASIEEKGDLLKNIESSEDLKIHVLQHPKQQYVVLKDVTIYYAEKTACKNVGFVVEQGQRIAITGKNGAGKSSILKAIYGDAITYHGKIQKANHLCISYVRQDTAYLQGSLKEFIDKENIEESLFKTILRKLDFSREQFDKEIQTYSSGQKKKVLLAGALAKPAHLYIFDEPLNYIDVFSRIQIEKVLKNNKVTVLFVEHDVAFKKAIATKTIALS